MKKGVLCPLVFLLGNCLFNPYSVSLALSKSITLIDEAKVPDGRWEELQLTHREIIQNERIITRLQIPSSKVGEYTYTVKDAFDSSAFEIHPITGLLKIKPTAPLEPGKFYVVTIEAKKGDKAVVQNLSIVIIEATVDEAKFRIFEPKARIYFDTGKDQKDEIDIFQDGSISPNINLFEVFWPVRYWNWLHFPDNWRWGPALGIGLGPAGQSSKDNTEDASGAPVWIGSAGLLLEFPLPDQNTDGHSVGIEAGYAQGVSTDEGFRDTNDGAIFVGFSLNLKWGQIAKESEVK